MAAVLRGEPNWSALPSGLPPGIRVLLRRCLEKDRRDRTRDASAANLVVVQHWAEELKRLVPAK